MKLWPQHIFESTGVFVRVVSARKRSISRKFCTPSKILASLKHRKSRSYQKMGPERDFHEGRKATHRRNRTPTENSARFDEIEYLDDQIGIECS
jgi:hypothetical protein